MKPGEAFLSLVKPICSDISIHDGPERFLREFDAAPVKARTLIAALCCYSEICNGGLHQFFYNSTGILAPEAVLAFRTIDMPQTAAIVEQGMSWFGEPYPSERAFRIEKLGNVVGQQFHPLDDEFFRLTKSENGGFLQAADTYALTP